jgi:hypothetical protein
MNIFLFIYFWCILALKIHTCLIKKGELVMKSQYRMLFAFVALLLLVSLACYGGGTPTSAPTQPPVNNEPPVAAPTDQPQRSRLFRHPPRTFLPRSLMAILAIGPTLQVRMM